MGRHQLKHRPHSEHGFVGNIREAPKSTSTSPLISKSCNNTTKQQVISLVNQAFINGTALCQTFDADGNTLLHLCVLYDMHECARKLLSAGASPMMKNNNRRSAIDLSLDSGNQMMLQLLSRREKFRRFVGAEDEIDIDDEEPFFRGSSSERGSLMSNCPAHDKSDREKSCFAESTAMAFSLGPVFEDYCDWNSTAHCFHLKNLMDELKVRERSLFHEMQSLSICRTSALCHLRQLSDGLREQEHQICLHLWDAIRIYRENKLLLDLIAHDAARLKRMLSLVDRTVYWLGEVQLRGSSSLVFEKWRTAKLLVTGTLVCVQVCDKSDELSLEELVLRHSEAAPTAPSASKRQEPFFSLSTGPVRRQLRRGRRMLKQHLSSRRYVLFDLQRLHKLVVVKTSTSQRLDKELVFYYAPEDGKSCAPSRSSSSVPISPRRKSCSSEESLSSRGTASAPATSSAPRSLSVLRLRIQDGLRRVCASEPFISSADNVAHVVKTLLESVEVVCQLDGRCYDFRPPRRDSSAPLFHAPAGESAFAHAARRESIDDAVLGLRSGDACRSPTRSLSTTSCSAQRPLTQRLSMSLSSSGATSQESISTIASVVKRCPLDGINEEEDDREGDEESPRCSCADQGSSPSFSKKNRRSLSSLVDTAAEDNDSCDDMVQRASESAARSVNKKTRGYESPRLRDSMISNINAIPRLRRLLMETREHTQNVNNKLCDAVTQREKLLENLHYLRSLREIAENPPMSPSLRSFYACAPSIEALLALLAVYRDNVDRTLQEDPAIQSNYAQSASTSRSPFFQRLGAESHGSKVPSFSSAVSGSSSHALVGGSSNNVSLSDATEFIRLVINEDTSPMAAPSPVLHRNGERTSSVSTLTSSKIGVQSFSSKTPSSFACSPREESTLASRIANRSRSDLFGLIYDVDGESPTKEDQKLSKFRGALGAPPTQYLVVYEDVLKTVGQFWDCEFEAFEVAERLARCLVQREKSGKQLLVLREKEITFTHTNIMHPTEELFDVDI